MKSSSHRHSSFVSIILAFVMACVAALATMAVPQSAHALSLDPQVKYSFSYKDLGFKKDAELRTPSMSQDGKYLFVYSLEKLVVRNVHNGQQQVFPNAKTTRYSIVDPTKNIIGALHYTDSYRIYVDRIELQNLDSGKKSNITFPRGDWRVYPNAVPSDKLSSNDSDLILSFIAEGGSNKYQGVTLFTVNISTQQTETHKILLQDFVDVDEIDYALGAPFCWKEKYCFTRNGDVLIHINEDESGSDFVTVDAFDTSNGNQIAQWKIEVYDSDYVSWFIHDEHGVPTLVAPDKNISVQIIQLNLQAKTYDKRKISGEELKRLPIFEDSDKVVAQSAYTRLLAYKTTNEIGKSSELGVIDSYTIREKYVVKLDKSYGGSPINKISEDGRYFITTKQSGKNMRTLVVLDLKNNTERSIDYPIPNASVDSDMYIYLSADNVWLTISDTTAHRVVVVSTGIATSTMALVKHQLGVWWIVLLIAAVIVVLLIVALVVLKIVKRRRKKLAASAEKSQEQGMPQTPAVTPVFPIEHSSAVDPMLSAEPASSDVVEQDLPFCTNCGTKQRHAGAKFCFKCGTKIE